MPAGSYRIQGVRVYACAAEGPQPRDGRHAIELITAAWEHRAQLIVIPAARLGDDFFRLRTRIAGEILQKFLTYGLRVAIIGNISRHLSESAALRDFVYECNRGPHIWFVSTLDELETRLQRPSLVAPQAPNTPEC